MFSNYWGIAAKSTHHQQAVDPRLAPGGRRTHHVNPRKLIGYTVLIVFATIYLYPFAIQIATSFESGPRPLPIRCP